MLDLLQLVLRLMEIQYLKTISSNEKSGEASLVALKIV